MHTQDYFIDYIQDPLQINMYLAIMSVVDSILGPVVAFLESLSYIGINSHIIKLDYLVS